LLEVLSIKPPQVGISRLNFEDLFCEILAFTESFYDPVPAPTPVLKCVAFTLRPILDILDVVLGGGGL
jgi:hypothetical protein